MNTETLWVIQLGKLKDFTPEVIRAHVEHIRCLDDAGKLVLAGPFSGEPAGGLIILRAGSEAEALAIAGMDPFVAQGFESCTVRALTPARRTNNYLLD
jgi:uncharacterized protein YciI